MLNTPRRIGTLVAVAALLSLVVASGTAGAAIEKVYWNARDSTQVRRANLDGSGVETLTGGVAGYGIAVDGAAGKMYVAEGVPSKITRANLDGTGPETVLDAPTIFGPLDVAIDGAGGKIYWTEGWWGSSFNPGRNIRRANLDGSNVETLVHLTYPSSEPWGIALDIPAGKMYWVDRNRQRVQRANLDGSSIETIFQGSYPADDPMYIDVDTSAGKVYWAEYFTGRVRRANLDGTSREIVLAISSSSFRPNGLALHVAAGKMYVSDPQGGRIARANLDGSGFETLTTSTGVYPMGMALGPAQQDLAVQLTNRRARRAGDAVVIEWRTLSEIKHAGFRVLREASDGELVDLTPRLIGPATRGGELSGASYRFTDHDAPLGRTRYWLEDVDTTGRATRHGPVDVLPAWRIDPALPGLPLGGAFAAPGDLQSAPGDWVSIEEVTR